uniref:hypothetical protein n=1 Tax=Segatella copri TaxID=165179 RepID=UPI003FF0FBE0
MDTIDISQNIQDFKQVFENESRIIFSARFGDGKSYFLNEFMKSYGEKKNDYYFITLHPVNYVVEENRDVIEYIKRDILFQLIKDNRIYDFKEGYDKIFDAVCNVESLFKLADFAASIIPVKGLKEGYKALKGLVSTIDEKRKEQDVLHVVDDYLNGFYGKSGSISECDAFTYLIQKSLEQMMAKSVLIIEDLDRIDPAHLFRIMNVLSSQVDNPYYSEFSNGNKFGFDKIILVMDYEIARHLFHHFYGKEANYEGYMNKFLNTLLFSYSIKEEAQRQVEAKLLDICKSDEVLRVVLQLSSNKEECFSVPSAIMQMSVRRCKEFLDMDVCNLIRNTWMKGDYDIPTQTVWTKILACYHFLFPDRSLNAIQEMMLYGFSDLQLAELYAPYNYALKGVNEFYMEYDNDMYDFCYIKGENLVRRGRVLSWQSDKTLDVAEIRKDLRKMNLDIRNLLLG